MRGYGSTASWAFSGYETDVRIVGDDLATPNQRSSSVHAAPPRR
jgi:hypothetical protein